MSDHVYILGTGMIKFGKYLDKSIKTLTGEALELVLSDSALTRGDIEAAWFSNAFWGMYSFQHSIRGQVALSANGLEGIPIVNVENACASGSSALHSAWMSIKAELYDCVLAIGVEKVYDEDRLKVMQSFIAATDVEEITQKIAVVKQGSMTESGLASQVASAKPGDHSPFMDFYALGARLHMEKYGITQRQLAVIAAKAHTNAVHNPLAQYTFPLTLEQALADREVAYPLTRAMCAPIGDGAAATILCSERFLKAHPSGRAVRIRASVLRSGTRAGNNDIGKRAVSAAYAIAGLGPEDIHVAEVHDATAFGELHQTEELGFCAPGDGGLLAESGATAITGKIPVNPSGGLISRGHPIGASGLAQIHELTTQLRREAGVRQVQPARIALAENGGGILGREEAAMAIHILEKA